MLLSSSAPPGGAKHGMAGRSTPIIRSIALADFSCWRGPRTRALTYSRRAMPYRTVPSSKKKSLHRLARPRRGLIDNPDVQCAASLMARVTPAGGGYHERVLLPAQRQRAALTFLGYGARLAASPIGYDAGLAAVPWRTFFKAPKPLRMNSSDLPANRGAHKPPKSDAEIDAFIERIREYAATRGRLIFALDATRAVSRPGIRPAGCSPTCS